VTRMAEALSGLLRGGDTPALVSPDESSTTSHDRLAVDVETLAARLAGAGVRRGDRVALVLPNGPEIVETIFALAAIGAAASPLNPAYTKDEFAFYLGDLDPRLLLVPAGEAAAARAAAHGVTVVDMVSSPGSAPSLVIDGHEVRPKRPGESGGVDDIALLLHTSGTTSRPKQVPLLQRNLMASTRTIAEHYRLRPDDVSYCAMPLFHIHGLVASTLASLAAGGCAVVPRRVAPRRFWPQARATGTTWLSAGPTLHQMLLDQRDREGSPPTLRFVRSCSSALSPALFQRAEDEYGVPMLEAYGMTEASHQMASNPLPPAPRPPGSVGVATGTDIGVVDSSRRFLSEGQAGEIVIRGPGVTPGYLANPGANEEAFFDGWFRTGDRGVLEAGYLRLEGRLKELIIRGGENISPAEVEDVLKAHPAVADAACFGIPDDKYGEEVGAAVSLSGEADERILLEHCRARLTAVKVPKRLFLLPEIPRTPTGKLQRRRIAESLLGDNA
jgi:acyl-CoA synthetase (AMP-forming)/AMP-acid ligase II